MYPEVEKYVAACEAAKQVADLAYAENRAARSAALRAALETGWQAPKGACCKDCAYSETPFGQLLDEHWSMAADAQEAAEKAAWDALKASEVPLVRWIAENCNEYYHEANQVLRALPAPMGELNALARERGWCGVWQQFREEAEEAGVLPAEPEVSA